MWNHRHSNTSGFTLIELLAVLVIVAVLTAIAAPSWLAFITNRRLETTTEDTLQVYRLAQNQAIRTRSTQRFALDLQADVPQATRFYDLANAADSLWEPMGTEIQPDSIDIQVLTANTINAATGEVTAWTAVTAPYVVLELDHLGAIEAAGTSTGAANNFTAINLPIAVAMVEQRAATIDPNTTIRRCFIIETLLGGTREPESGAECPAP